jgi:L-ascorbate metabolism protein UlaG (beta-lactamase superfamily)
MGDLMNVTKYEHACLLITEGTNKIIIDPGSFTKLPDELAGITSIIITEEHQDHFNIENIEIILAQSPDAKIFTTAAVHEQLAKNSIESTVIKGEQTVSSGSFTLSFYETDHAVVYGSSPCHSLPVKVNDYLYYPSDTYHVIADHVHILALPTSGPWYKLSDSVDFAKQINCDVIIPTHNALNSDTGNMVIHNSKQSHLEQKITFLQPGESFSG